MTDQMQTVLNRLSLVMTMPEDIVKACKGAGMPPAMTEVLLRLHNQQIELEKAVNELRPLMVQIAQLVERQADIAGYFSDTLVGMAKHTGYGQDEHVSSTEVGQD
jgi:hypothetical protein